MHTFWDLFLKVSAGLCLARAACARPAAAGRTDGRTRDGAGPGPRGCVCWFSSEQPLSGLCGSKHHPVLLSAGGRRQQPCRGAGPAGPTRVGQRRPRVPPQPPVRRWHRSDTGRGLRLRESSGHGLSVRVLRPETSGKRELPSAGRERGNGGNHRW